MKKKLSVLLLSFLTIYLLTFFLPRMMPGDPFSYNSADVSENTDTEMSEEQKEYMRSYYGMDKPLLTQLLTTLGRHLRGDWGQSIHFKAPAGELIRERLPWSLWIMGASLGISSALGIFLALLSIRRRGADRIVYAAASLLTEIPAYLVGLLLLFFPGARVDWIPLSGGKTAFALYPSLWGELGDILLHSLLPVGAMCIFTTHKFYFTARSSFLSVRGKGYMLNAKAKALSEGRIRRRYLLRNGLTPIVAGIFLSLGTTIGATVLVENVFAYPGVGTLMREAVRYRDYVLMEDIFLLSAAMVLVSLFLGDLLNSLVDREVH